MRFHNRETISSGLRGLKIAYKRILEIRYPKIEIYMVMDSTKITVKVKERNEIKCNLDQLGLPKNAKGWICDSVQNDVQTSAKCKLECDDHFQSEQGKLRENVEKEARTNH